MKLALPLLAAATGTILCPAPASAATLVYRLIGPNSGGYNAIWQMSSTPTPDQTVPDQGFAIFRVAGNFPGAIEGAAYLDFFSFDNGGGLSIADADEPTLFVSLSGAQLYSGGEATPLLSKGTFALTDADGVPGYSLRVADVGAVVPEPATWALMILGFAAAGGAMRRRTRRATIRFA